MSKSKSVLEEVREASKAHGDSTYERDVAIRTAHANGWSLREIARTCSLSPETVRRIVRSTP